MPDHERNLPWTRRPDGSLIAACSCGWQSGPCANGEFANQAWERHVTDLDTATPTPINHRDGGP